MHNNNGPIGGTANTNMMVKIHTHTNTHSVFIIVEKEKKNYLCSKYERMGFNKVKWCNTGRLHFIHQLWITGIFLFTVRISHKKTITIISTYVTFHIR